MAFCNSCGSVIDVGVRFCPKCGKPTSAAGAAGQGVVPPPSPMASAPMASAPLAQGQPVAAGGSNAVKIILIVVAVMVGIGIIGAVTVGFVIHRAISRTHIESRDGNVRVHSPFGNVETSTDPEEAAKNLGVDVYPGSNVVKGSAANMSFGKAHTVAAQFETNDAPDTVAQFYRSKYPSATFSSSEADHFTLIAGSKDNVTTITVEPEEGKTRISISRITGKSND